MKERRPFTPQEDELILKLLAPRHVRLQRLSDACKRTAASLSQRYKRLMGRKE